MRSYGMNKATEFSKKQISVIYGKAKAGQLKIEKWLISRFYDLADFYGIDWNRGIEKNERDILRILDAVFSDDLQKAQEEINFVTESWFKCLSIKGQKNADRAFVA